MPVRTSSLSQGKKTGLKRQKMIKPLMYYPIAVAIATSGCQKETPKKPVITSEYEMKCENVKNTFETSITRCENKEVICYTKTNGISCIRKRFK